MLTYYEFIDKLNIYDTPENEKIFDLLNMLYTDDRDILNIGKKWVSYDPPKAYREYVNRLQREKRELEAKLEEYKGLNNLYKEVYEINPNEDILCDIINTQGMIDKYDEELRGIKNL